MNFIKSLIKFIQALILIIIPFVLFYWLLTLINLEFLKPMVAFFAYFMNPVLSLVPPVFQYKIKYDNEFVSLIPLVFTIMSTLIAVGLAFLHSFLEGMETTVKAAHTHIKQAEQTSKVKKIVDQKNKILTQHRIIYVLLSIKKKENQSTHLYEKVADNLEKNYIKSIMSKIASKAADFRHERYKEEEKNEHTVCLVFYNTTEATDFAFAALAALGKANKELANTGLNYTLSVAFHCSTTIQNAPLEFAVASKIMNLAGDNEFYTSEIFKNKYEATTSKTNVKFIPRGTYMIHGRQEDVFQLKVVNAMVF